MKKQRLMKGIISGALVVGLLLGSVGLVAATTDNNSSAQSSSTKSSIGCRMAGGAGHEKGMRIGMGMGMDLSSLVADGIITSAESAAIQAKIDALNDARKDYFKTNQAAKTERIDLLTTLVNENIINSDTAAAIRTAMQTQRQQEQQTRLTKGLSSLVEKGTITSAQSEQILAELKAQQTKRQAEMDKVKAMTETEREAYFKANPNKKASLLADLVTAGTITQEQANAVRTVIGGPKGAGKGGPAPDRTSQGVSGQKGSGKGMGHGGGMGRGPANSCTTQINTNK